MARTVGQGNQILLFNYRTDLDWDILNNQFINLFSDGILYANVIVKDTQTITVNYISAFIIPENAENEIVKMETTSDFDISITAPANQIYLVLTYEFATDEFNSVQFNLTNQLYPTTHAIPVCRLVYDGSNNLIDIDYSIQKKSYGTHSHDLQYYTKTVSDNLFVHKAGDIMTGELQITISSGNNWLSLDSGDGSVIYYSGISLKDNGLNRFTIYKDLSNDFYIARYDDSGNIINSAITIYRNINAIDFSGSSIKISGDYKEAGYLYSGTVDPTNTTRLNYDGYFYATRVYNAVYNDIADFLEIDFPEEEIEYGKVYKRTEDYKIRKTEKLDDNGILGIASDTYGYGLGKKENSIPIAISGFVLAYVDDEYKPGTPLTSKEDGWLTKAEEYHKNIVAYYDRPEKEEYWNNIKVNGRHWVKIK